MVIVRILKIFKDIAQVNYQICTKTIMDTSDPAITFNEAGECHYWTNFIDNIKPNWNPNEVGIKQITPLIEKIKKDGKNKDHDCIIGISGGLDSSYAAYVAKEKFGLRPLMYHCDTGWNSDLGVSNIEKIISGLKLDLVTDVVDWEQMKNLQRAFFKSQVPFVDMAQDAILFSSMYNFAAKNNFKYVITGGNNSTECVRECLDWTYFSTDTRHLFDIFNKHGEGSIDKLPMCDIFKYQIYYRFFKQTKIIKILDYYPYFKNDAIETLHSKFSWTAYPQKHYESRFTRFYEAYWTPKKFNFDKRRAYMSSLIMTGQMSREEALMKIKTPELDIETLEYEFEYVAKKLDWSREEFLEIFNAENKSFRDYKNNLFLLNLATKISNFLGFDNRIFK